MTVPPESPVALSGNKLALSCLPLALGRVIDLLATSSDTVDARCVSSHLDPFVHVRLMIVMCHTARILLIDLETL